VRHLRPFGARAHRRASASKKEAFRKRSGRGEIAPYRLRPFCLLLRRAKPITARATGLHLRRIFPKAEKPPIATLALMQFALSAVTFGLRRDEGLGGIRAA